MALVVPGPLVSVARRSVGDVTFQRVHGRDIARRRPVTPVHNTGPAVASKNRFRWVWANWRVFKQRVSTGVLDAYKLAARGAGETATEGFSRGWLEMIYGRTWRGSVGNLPGSGVSILSVNWFNAQSEVEARIERRGDVHAAQVLLIHGGFTVGPFVSFSGLISLTSDEVKINTFATSSDIQLLMFPFERRSESDPGGMGETDAAYRLAT